MELKHHVRGSLMLAAVAVVLGSTSPSEAFESRLSYGACVQDSGSTYSYNFGGNTLPANTLVLSCPVTDTTSLSHPSMTAVNVHYDDNNSSASVFAFRCVYYPTGAGGACGDSVTSGTGFTGSAGFGVPNTPASFATQWNQAANFAAIGVYLPQKSSGGAISYLKGYYMAN